MNDDEARALGERWTKAGGGWRPGMRSIGIPRDLLADDEDDDGRVSESTPSDGILLQGVPDLRDPATRGAALDVVRERYGAPNASLVNERSNRWAILFLGAPVVHGATEAEALVVALESAMSDGVVGDLVRAGLVLPEEVGAARPLVAAWDEDTAGDVGCWAADLIMWTTDTVGWRIGAVPVALRTLLTAIGGSDRIAGYE